MKYSIGDIVIGRDDIKYRILKVISGSMENCAPGYTVLVIGRKR